MSAGKIKAALGGRYCILGDSRSGRTRLLRHIATGYGRTRYIATDFINSVKVSSAARILLVNKPERELDAAGRAELSNMLVAFAGTVFFITNDIKFIESTATNITDTSGSVLSGGWKNFIDFSISSKILHRCPAKILPVAAFPPAQSAPISAEVAVLGRKISISGHQGRILFTGPLAAAALEAAASAIGAAAGYYNHTYDKEVPPPREYVGILSIWGRFPLLSGSESARAGLAAALLGSVPVLDDPTRFLSLPQIFGLVEHLRGRTVIFTSADAAFINMMRPHSVHEYA